MGVRPPPEQELYINLRIALNQPLRPGLRNNSCTILSMLMSTAPFFNRHAYFVREHIGFLKLKDSFDILDAETREHLGYATEENPAWVNWTRLLLQKHRMPTTVVVRRLADDAPVLRLERGWRFLRSKIRVYDGQDTLLGYFESKILTLGGGFHVYNARGIRVADITGNWIGWDSASSMPAGRPWGW